jgi:hypothetical protein
MQKFTIVISKPIYATGFDNSHVIQEYERCTNVAFVAKDRFVAFKTKDGKQIRRLVGANDSIAVTEE